MTDAAQLAGLVRAAQRGDGLAMAELLDALAPAVGRWCGPIALQDADDAAQEAMIAILRGLRGLRDPAALFGWARAIAVREAVRVARRAAREQPAELGDLPAPGDLTPPAAATTPPPWPPTCSPCLTRWVCRP